MKLFSTGTEKTNTKISRLVFATGLGFAVRLGCYNFLMQSCVEGENTDFVKVDPYLYLNVQYMWVSELKILIQKNRFTI